LELFHIMHNNNNNNNNNNNTYINQPRGGEDICLE
jgi:hypothetical protein